jgi:hypothetical protein
VTTSEKPAPLPGDLTTLDKAALITLAAGVAFKLLLHNVGATLETTAWWFDGLRWVFGLVAFVAFDLVVLAVIVDGRRNPPDVRSYLALGGATLAAALIGLDVAGVWRQPWMQAAQAVLMLLFGVHLMRPRLFASVQAECARLTAECAALVVSVQAAHDERTQLAQRADLAEGECARLRTLASDAVQQSAQIEAERAESAQLAAQLDAECARQRTRAEQAEQAVAQLRTQLRSLPAPDPELALVVGKVKVNVTKLAAELGLERTALYRAAQKAGETIEGGEA